jgi:hypothetical protein
MKAAKKQWLTPVATEIEVNSGGGIGPETTVLGALTAGS